MHFKSLRVKDTDLLEERIEQAQLIAGTFRNAFSLYSDLRYWINSIDSASNEETRARATQKASSFVVKINTTNIFKLLPTQLIDPQQFEFEELTPYMMSTAL